MDATQPPGTAAREWCGTPLPPEVETVPHPANLRIVLPLPGWVRRFRAVWCVLLALMSVPLVVRGTWPAGVAMLLVAVYLWTRPARLTVTFRPGRRWVTIASPVNWAVRVGYSVGVGVHQSSGGWRASLSYMAITLAETGPEPDRDRAVARLLPLANTLRREMGDAPLPPP